MSGMDVSVRFEDDIVHVVVIGLRVAVSRHHPGWPFETSVRRAVEKTYSFVKSYGGKIPEVAVCDVTDAVVDAIKSHPEFPAWDVHSA